MVLRPIETSYAGCRFRSRLEARWAVFFDTLGIAWVYEAQGYECQPRLFLSGDEPFWYLPDFWLPDLELHAEVKGALTEQETRRLLDAAAWLSAPGNGCGDGPELIVFGPVPNPDRWDPVPVPVRLHMHKGILEASPWTGEGAGGCHISTWEVASDDGTLDGQPADRHDWPCTARFLLQAPFGVRAGSPAGGMIRRGYRAARSARFEHGQHGAPGRWSR